MIIEVDGVILNMDNIAIIQKGINALRAIVEEGYIVLVDDKIIFEGSEEERDKLYNKLWAEIKERERILITVDEHGNYKPMEYYEHI